jgi:hypothetical protein
MDSKINPNFSLIGFSDGVYLIQYNRFIRNSNNGILNNKISTLKYYKQTCQWASKKPFNWINALKNALGIVNNKLDFENYLNICLYLINIFFKNIFNKGSTFSIHGKNNTGKTSLITNLLFNYFGVENICNVISESNFNCQDLVGKMVIIINESQYNKDIPSDLLNIMSSESMVVGEKYSNNFINIKPLPLITISNEIFKNENTPINDTLKCRILKYRLLGLTLPCLMPNFNQNTYVFH